MKRIDLAQDIKPVTEFRANAAALIERLRETKRALVLTQHGSSAVVVLDVEEYERLVDELEILRDIQLAEQQIGEGRGVAHDEARKQVLDELEP